MMEERLPELPKGWVWTRLGEISEINPKFNKRDFQNDLEVTFLPMRCVEELTGQVDLSIKKRLSEVFKGYTYFIEGDLLFSKITPCMENGKIAIARGLKNGIGFGSTEFHVIRLHELLPRKFFFFFLIQDGLRKDAQRNMTGSAGQLRVPVNYMNQIRIPLPPLAEQHRIVAKIEELFTRLEAGIEALKKIKAQLKRYRRAVLKYAFEGKLTQQWREANKDKLEPASTLLEKIKEERKNVGANLRVRPNLRVRHDSGQIGQTHRSAPTDAFDLPELPEGWVWTFLENITINPQHDIVDGPFGSNMKASEYRDKGVPIIRLQNIERNYFIKQNIKYISEEKAEKLSRHSFSKGDILLTKLGEPLGKACIVPDDFQSGIIVADVVRLKIPEYILSKEYMDLLQISC